MKQHWRTLLIVGAAYWADSRDSPPSLIATAVRQLGHWMT